MVLNVQKQELFYAILANDQKYSRMARIVRHAMDREILSANFVTESDKSTQMPVLDAMAKNA